MKVRFALVAASAIALAACGSSDDASLESDAETVEPAANAALEEVDEVSVEDPMANVPEEPVDTTPPVDEQQQIEEAGNNAAATSEEVADLLVDE